MPLKHPEDEDKAPRGRNGSDMEALLGMVAKKANLAARPKDSTIPLADGISGWTGNLHG